MRLEEVDPSPLGFIERPGLSRGDEIASRVECSGLQAGVRGGERPIRPPAGLARQHDRPLQKRCGRGKAPAPLRSAGRPLEVGSDPLIGPGGGARQVPRTPVRVCLAVGCQRQSLMSRPAFIGRRRPIHG
ncbi:MAG: hypothetical protein ABSH51_12250 [Solirubrobacteraceae bacterium]